ncbi:hypothetical protein ACIBAC_40580 [Streptomyces sp. NPDC051362]|uniref:hypothetical protein n=1 Tax=Streptomyces sp. NPDC051362 TaxID=3365651 RepID=UPI00379A4530
MTDITDGVKPVVGERGARAGAHAGQLPHRPRPKTPPTVAGKSSKTGRRPGA